jgi:hypothetical protein
MFERKEKSSRRFTLIYVLVIICILAAEISIEFAYRKPAQFMYGPSITLALPALDIPRTPLP